MDQAKCFIGFEKFRAEKSIKVDIIIMILFDIILGTFLWIMSITLLNNDYNQYDL